MTSWALLTSPKKQCALQLLLVNTFWSTQGQHTRLWVQILWISSANTSYLPLNERDLRSFLAEMQCAFAVDLRRLSRWVLCLIAFVSTDILCIKPPNHITVWVESHPTSISPIHACLRVIHNCPFCPFCHRGKGGLGAVKISRLYTLDSGLGLSREKSQKQRGY